MHLHAAHPRPAVAGQQHDLVAARDLARPQGPGATVPAPRIVNARSTCSLASPLASARLLTVGAARSSAARSSSSPSPVRDDTATTSAPGNSSDASSIAISGSPRSLLVTAITPVFTPSARNTAACSRV